MSYLAAKIWIYIKVAGIMHLYQWENFKTHKNMDRGWKSYDNTKKKKRRLKAVVTKLFSYFFDPLLNYFCSEWFF